jgi:lipoic acid synthetase
MGQYLQPTPFHLPVDRWVTPAEFDEHAAAGTGLGIAHVEAGPLVRSSYRAGEQLRRAREALSAASAG